MKKKIENMTIKEIQKEIDSNDEKSTALFIQKQPIDKKISALYHKNKKLKDQIAKIRSNQKTINWEWLLQSDDESMGKYRLRQKKLREINLESQGRYDTTGQVQIQIRLIKNDKKSLLLTLRGLKKILKYIKPFEGFKRMGISEASLAAGGVWELLIDEAKDQYDIMITRYHRPEVKYEFKDLKSVLEKIQSSLYYEDANKDDSDDYDNDIIW